MTSPLRNTASFFSSDDTVLEIGQLGFETDTGLTKLGDGETAWNDMGYQQTPSYFSTVSGANDLVSVFKFSHLLGLYVGLKVRLYIDSDNTGAVTFDFNEFGAQSVKKNITESLTGGELQAGSFREFVWDGTNWQLLSSTTASSGSTTINDAGMIVEWGSDVIPSGWLKCDGAAVSRTTYSTLFAIIGTTYGIGDGVTTFNLPDGRQRFPLGQAVSGTGNTLGGTGGNIDHTHTFGATTSSDGTHDHGGATGAPSATVNAMLQIIPPQVASDDHTHSISSDGEHTHTISGTTGTANPPFFVINFIIKTDNTVVTIDNVWLLNGNSGTTPGTHFIGTTDNTDWIIKTNNAERIRVKSTGEVGVGVSAPNVRLDVDLGFAVRHTTNSQITANQNDYAIGAGTTFRLSSDASRNITGMTGGSDGKILNIQNTGTNPIVFKHQDGGSVAANRLSLPLSVDYTLNGGHSLTFQYDSTSSRWKLLSQSNNGQVMQFYHASTNLADATTYFFGGGFDLQAQTATGAVHLKASKTGVITRIDIRINGVAGSAENSTLSIRVNDTTDYTLSTTIRYNSLGINYSFTGLNIPLNEGDFFMFKLVAATFVTNPTSVRHFGTILISN